MSFLNEDLPFEAFSALPITPLVADAPAHNSDSYEYDYNYDYGYDYDDEHCLQYGLGAFLGEANTQHGSIAAAAALQAEEEYVVPVSLPLVCSPLDELDVSDERSLADLFGSDDVDGSAAGATQRSHDMGSAHQPPVNTMHIRRQKIREFPMLLAEACNNGDMEKLRRAIDEVACERCMFKSPAFDEPLEGREHIFEFYWALFEDFPDGVVALRDINLTCERELKFRMFFHGKRVEQKVNKRIYAKANIARHMKLSKYTSEEILEIGRKTKYYSEKSAPLNVFGKANTTLVLNKRYQIKKFMIDYTITSFAYDDAHEMNTRDNIEKGQKS
jgi:hypothetical protein